MTMCHYFRRMAENNLWANDRLYRAVLELDQDAFEAARTSFFPSIKATLNHILLVDLYYLDMLRQGGEGLLILQRWTDIRDPVALFDAQSSCDRDYLTVCNALREDDVSRLVVTDRGSAGQVMERTGDLLMNIFMHDVHHRGQVHAMLSGTPVPPPQLDEYFLDFDLERRRTEVLRLGLGTSKEVDR